MDKCCLSYEDETSEYDRAYEDRDDKRHDAPYCNAYEMAKPESRGYDQSGMK